MSHRVLVIDHHPQGLQRVVDPLREAGYEVAVAQTVADGASTFGRFEPEIVFIAARLPRTHGTVLCRELKRTDSGSNTPIVLIVEGTGIQIDLPPLDQFGADRLLQKPFRADELLAVCRELLDEGTGPVENLNDETDSRQADKPDDGLSIALEELDSLDFDLPEEIVRNARDRSSQPTAVELSNDSGADIEDYLDDLLSDKKTTAHKPVANTEPSTGQDHDADAAVIDQLDLDNELNTTLGTEASPPQPSSTAPRRAAVPPAPTVTATVSEPPPPSEQAVGRFQTEAFTSHRPMPQPFPSAADVKPVAGPARWSWIAIPLTVAIVFLAAFFIARPRATAPEQLLDVASRAGGEFEGAGFSFPLGPIDETDPPISSIEPVRERMAETSPPAVAAIDSPTVPTPRKRKTPAPDPIVESEPEPEPEPVVRNTVPAIEPRIRQADETPSPIVQITPPPVAFTVQHADETPEPSVETTPPIPEPAPPVESIPEPIVLEPEVNDTATPEVLHEPISRDPILIQRVEPRVTKKDLKKGGVVVLRIRINETGAVTRVLVDQGIPGSPLEAAAVAAVLRWRYEPALDRDVPVEAWTTARFTFQ